MAGVFCQPLSSSIAHGVFRFFAFLPKAYKGSRRALEWDVLGVAQDEAAMGDARSAEHVGAENLF